MIICFIVFIFTLTGAVTATGNLTESNYNEGRYNSSPPDSFVFIHAHNPEGVEIASIHHNDINSVQIYDNNTFIGNSAYNEETHPKFYTLSPGEHNIKATFNGMTQEKNIYLNPGEARELIFVFNRTNQNLDFEVNDSLDINITWNHTVMGYVYGLDKSSTYFDGHIGDFFYSNDTYHPEWCWLDGTITGHIELTFNQGYFSVTNQINGNVTASRISYGARLNFKPWGKYLLTTIPANNNFNSWYIQTNGTGIFPEISVGPSSPISFDNGFRGDSSSNDIDLFWTMTGRPGFSTYIGEVPLNESFTGTYDFKISSVPYDLYGTGINTFNNFAPIANFIYPSNDLKIGQPISLDGSSSSDSDGYIINYFWDFGDGSTDSGQYVNHIFTSEGLKTVSLTVTDNKGLNNSKIITVNVINPNIAAFTYNLIPSDDQIIISVDASSSIGDIVSYNWDFGDGTTNTGITQNHVYQNSGDYTIKLTIFDVNGYSDSISQLVSIIQRDENPFSINSWAPGYGNASANSSYYEYIGKIHSDPGTPPGGALSPGVEFGSDDNGNLYVEVNVQLTTGQYQHYYGDEYVKVWIDWDKDGIFESNELVMNKSGSPLTNCFPSYNGHMTFYQDGIIIPKEYLVFKPVNPDNPWPSTYMRVVLNFDQTPGATGTAQWGDVEDYKITPYLEINKEQIKQAAQSAKNKLIALKLVVTAYGAINGSSGDVNNSKIIGGYLQGLATSDWTNYRAGIVTGIIAAIADPTINVIMGLTDDIINSLITKYDQIINDPPDYNYSSVAQLDLDTTVSPIYETDYDRAIADIFNTISHHKNIQKALLTSIERYDGAVLDNKTQYIILQAKAIQKYSEMSSSNLYELNLKINTLNNLMNQYTSDPIYKQQIENLQNDLSTLGFTAEEISYFQSLEMDDNAINNYLQELLNFNPNSIEQVFEEYKNNNTANLNTYYDLESQASNAQLFQTLDKPIIVTTSPSNGDTNVSPNKTISIKYHKEIKKNNDFLIELKNSTGTAIQFTSSISGKILYIDPISNLAEALYTLIIHTGAVTDLAGNPVANNSFKFSVGPSPKVASISPVSGSTKVARNKTITVTFNENIKSGTNYSKITLKSSTGKTITITKSISGKMLTIKHSALLSAKTKYTITLYSSCVKDYAGNPLAAKTITFTTGST